MLPFQLLSYNKTIQSVNQINDKWICRLIKLIVWIYMIIKIINRAQFYDIIWLLISAQ